MDVVFRYFLILLFGIHINLISSVNADTVDELHEGGVGYMRGAYDLTTSVLRGGYDMTASAIGIAYNATASVMGGAAWYAKEFPNLFLSEGVEEVPYGDDLRCQALLNMDEHKSLKDTVEKIVGFHKGMVRCYPLETDDQQVHGRYFALKLLGGHKFFILSYFPEFSGAVANDIVKIDVVADPSAGDFPEDQKTSYSIKYNLTESGSGEIKNLLRDSAGYYQGTDSKGLSLGVTVTKKKWAIYSVNTDSKGGFKAARFDRNIDRFLNDERMYIKYLLNEGIPDAYYDSYAEALWNSYFVWMAASALIARNPTLPVDVARMMIKGGIKTAPYVKSVTQPLMNWSYYLLSQGVNYVVWPLVKSILEEETNIPVGAAVSAGG